MEPGEAPQQSPGIPALEEPVAPEEQEVSLPEAQEVRRPRTRKRTATEIAGESEAPHRVTRARVAEQEVVPKTRASKKGTANKRGTGRRR